MGVLGPLVVRVSGEPVTLGGRARALLLALVARRSTTVSPDVLVEAVWPAGAPTEARNALQAQVSRLRRALGAVADRVVTEPAGYRLELAPGAVDADQLAAAVAGATRAGGVPSADADGTTAAADRAATLADALALWRGDPYADAGDDSAAVAEASRLHELRLEAVELEATAALAAGASGAQVAARVAADAVEHPTREGLQRAYAHALYLAGRQDAALDVLATLERHLREELGLDPDPGTVALQRAILDHDPALRPPERASRGGGPHPPRLVELTAPRTHFVGRVAELAELRERLAAARLVTLVGPGGTGKSRLAVEVAQSWRDPDRDVVVVELAVVADPGDVLAAIAAAAGLLPAVLVAANPERDAPADRPLSERIAAQLGGRERLMVLDNCEHLVDAAAEAVEVLLAAVPGLRILTTSREGLRVPGEVLLPVHPLPLPAADDVDPEVLLQSEAVELFVDRARSADPAFVLDASTAPAVAEVCRRLDGLPLALELAAARVATVPVGLLAERLSDRFRLLTGGRRTVPRQRTLEAVVAWSYDLLDDRQRAVLRRLGVFAGPPTVGVAEAVCAGDLVTADEVLAVLAELADKSLVELVEDGADTRVRMLETIRDFAQVRLDAEEDVAAVRDGHAEVMADRAAAAAVGLRGPDQLLWLARLDRDHDDLRAAIGWFLDRNPGRALEVANDLTWFWWLHGHANEGARWYEDLLDRVHDDPPPAAVPASAWLGFLRLFDLGNDIEVLAAASRACHDLLDRLHDRLEPFDRAAALITLSFVDFNLQGGRPVSPTWGDLGDAALEAARSSGDAWVETAAHFVRAVIAANCAERDLALQEAERALALADQTGDRWARYQTLELLSGMRIQTGDYARAGEDLAAAIELADAMGSVEQTRLMRVQHALTRMLDGDLDGARWELEALLDNDADDDQALSHAFASAGLARVAERDGNLDLAVAHYRSAADALLELGAMRGAAEALAGIAFARAGAGDGDAATAALDAALALVQELSHIGTTRPLLVEAGAAVALASGDPELAARRLGRAEELRAGAPLVAAERWHVDRIEADARALLGDEAVDAAQAAGRTSEGLLPPAD